MSKEDYYKVCVLSEIPPCLYEDEASRPRESKEYPLLSSRERESIKSILVHLKNKFLSRIKDNLFYEATCSTCSASYVDETQQSLHKRVSQNAAANSFSDFRVLEGEDDWDRRETREVVRECI